MIRIARTPLLIVALGATALFATACGAGHQAQATFVPTPVFDPTPAPTLPPSSYTPSAATATPSAPAAGDPQKGQQLAQSNGCAGCHSIDGSKIVGPTWKGLYGSTVTLSDGSTAKADDAYLKEAIVNPDAQIPKGFTKGVMPADFDQKLSASDVQDIIAYIKTLK